ncbi:hypothetical protein L195_g035535 [Trifolium pratense]|uniref:Uncharacterized protein n=1 Tax=Trifolium pratense TaxID=57577 RepID=A0A2K3LM04_TRIPR|nr:uncharacterized protein LOC123889275 [Trifolium pratense]XP_045798653.1 uncharacterized protein LOC123892822 [Trifolium pratense]PNX79549.1 hypothetical protein L195_g035535 [Trifolium pratense]
MKSATQNKQYQEEQALMIPPKKGRHRCVTCICILLFLLLVLVTVCVVLALTLFKPKEPITKISSATLQGISPRVTLPVLNIQINVTLDIKIQVENRNRASFKHADGISLLMYKGVEVGETDIYPGLIPARSSSILPCRLNLQADKLASNMTGFIGDLMGGELSLATVTRIPGRVTFLGFIKKHIVAKSNCQFVFGVPDMEIKSQICKNTAKL